jgi:Cu+-exporting ATPase
MRIENGTVREVPVEQIARGDRVQVAAESYVPVDGRVLSGRAALDLSMWTGESAPVEVEPGAELYGGSYVYSGAMTVEATAVGADSAIARIARMVEEAQTGKTRLQALADRVAGAFVPIVVVLAVLTLAGWLIAGAEATKAWSAMIAVLVVACPCAMGLATPVAVMVATGSAALRGIIVRDPAALERAATCDIALLDKTGTLTAGRFTIAAIRPVQRGSHADFTEHELLRLAATAEQFSVHPLAKAIVDEARARGIDLEDPAEYDAHAGLGVSVLVNGRRVLVGSRRYLERERVAVNAERGMRNAESDGDTATTVYVAADGRLAGCILLQDTPREAARDAVTRLKSLGLSPMLVTGDQEPAARAVASAVGIDEVRAAVSPPGKAELVRDLHKQGRRVLMVGDGINDAPALAAADVGIAMTGGTEVAAETAEIALAGDRIERVPDAVALARRSVRIIRQNLFWAFAYNVVAIPLAMLGILPAGYAAAAMMFSSISVVLNSLRLQRFTSSRPGSPG